MNEVKLKALEKKIQADCKNMAGIMILKDGKTVYEKYFHDGNVDSHLHIYSVTKSILSLLIGVAVDKGFIKSVDQKVLDFFPEYQVEKGETTIQKITLKHLLTMGAPYKYKFFAPYKKYFTSDDWITFSLDVLGGKGNIGDFRYAPLIGPDILSGILAKATGQSVLDFARQYLFTPMDIVVKDRITFQSKEEQLAFNQASHISGWVEDPKGIQSAGWGLTLSTMDMAKIGQLLLQDGVWNKQQLLSSTWIKEMCTVHNVWKKQNLSYGYLWWIIDSNEQVYAAMGDGGNVIYFNKQKNLVIAMTSFFKPKVIDRIDMIQQYIEPIFMDD